jgi:cytochrome c oxidase cbb3-type subunit I/II
MPPYPWLFEKETDIKSLPKKIAVQSRLGVPWPPMNQHEIRDMAEAQAREIAESLKDVVTLPGKPDLKGDALVAELEKKQVIALIAYIQKLGTYRVVGDGKSKTIPLDPDSYRRASAGEAPAPGTTKL